ncbi:glycine oxidase ThiO [Paraconexibacter sp.]|uniref:glycine oxidase ThiO n=1 Tax=Paraconexibacter sp. TaxID=2949640 RepID=UPI0035694462
MSDHSSPDVVVLGAGLAGLGVAYRAARLGARVVVVDRDRVGAGASTVAAGMLAPVAEADAGERDLLALGLQSAARWPGFARELQEQSGVDPGYRELGTLVVARDRDGAEALVREAQLREALGAPVQRLLPSAARRLEPALAPSIRGALLAPDDHAVDPRAALEALATAARACGVVVRERTTATGVAVHDGRVAGLDLQDGTRLAAESVVLAAGAWSGSLRDALPAEVRVPVRPVKGQLLRLRGRVGAAAAQQVPVLERVVRFDAGYLVPREDGTVVLGATMEEQGFDTQVTALGLHELLRDVHEVVPGVLELAVEQALAGLRPGTPDNAPLLGPHPALPGLHLATGHHRNGVLLAPITADLVAAGLTGTGAPIAPAFAPERFSTAGLAA